MVNSYRKLGVKMEEDMWSPAELGYMLLCYSRPAIHPEVTEASVIHKRLFDAKMIVKESSVWRSTKKGDIFVEAIMETPEPRCVWTMEQE